MLLTSCLGEAKKLHQQMIDGERLVVKENKEYRWIEYGGDAIQSIMKKSDPLQVISPVYQALLIFLRFNHLPLTVLNLGLGGATIDRLLASLDDISLTSVDASQPMINVAKQYFHLPNNVRIICQLAQQYVTESTEHFDIVICDLFVNDINPDFIFKDVFYRQLNKIMNANGCVLINIQINSEAKLLSTLLMIKNHFPYIALLEFENYKNIIVIASLNKIPNKTELMKKSNSQRHVSFSCLDNVIENMHYVPVNT